MSRIYVRIGTSNNKKLRRLGRILKIETPHAVGLAVALWEKLWVDELWDAKLTGWDESELAHACGWKGDEGELAKALLDVGLLCTSQCRHGEPLNGVWVVHDWVKEQGPLVKKLQANRDRDRAEEKNPSHSPPAETAPKEEDEGMRQILQQMGVQKTQGSQKQKREHVEAWRARGLKGSDILELVMNNPGKHLFEIQKLVEKGVSRPADAAKTPASPFLSAAEKITKEVEKRLKAQNG